MKHDWNDRYMPNPNPTEHGWDDEDNPYIAKLSDNPEAEGISVWYFPLFFNPPLEIIPIPAKCPYWIRKEVEAAFTAYWGDLSGCVNHQRAAIELLLDEMKVRRFTVNKKGKRCRVMLHHRIGGLPERTEVQKQLKHTLLALKFLGNEGSHAGEVGKQDALDGFDLLEYVLDEEARERDKHRENIRKKIVNKKGPRGEEWKFVFEPKRRKQR
jgi:hypothetical protein